MRNEELSSSTDHITMEEAIDAVREARNEQIKVFLDENYLRQHFRSKYDWDLSTIKLEFLKRDLQQSLIAPVDLVHYSTLIKSIKESNGSDVDDRNSILIQQEIEIIFKKYLY